MASRLIRTTAEFNLKKRFWNVFKVAIKRALCWANSLTGSAADYICVTDIHYRWDFGIWCYHCWFLRDRIGRCWSHRVLSLYYFDVCLVGEFIVEAISDSTEFRSALLVIVGYCWLLLVIVGYCWCNDGVAMQQQWRRSCRCLVRDVWGVGRGRRFGFQRLRWPRNLQKRSEITTAASISITFQIIRYFLNC